MSSYHRLTAYERHSISGHGLDWSDQPAPYKRYLHREPIPLPAPRPPRAELFDLILDQPPRPAATGRDPDAGDLAAVLLMSAGVTARQAQGAGLRAPASAGALYPAELYAAVCGVEGIDDGLYHFSPETPGLHLLWPGPLAAVAARGLGRAPSRLTFFITAYFWRSLWKYRSRAYRYCLLDSGHLLANLELACAACGWTPRTALDFADKSAGVFLGLAGEDEAALAAVRAGGEPDDPGPKRAGLPPMDLQAQPLSARMGRDPQVKAAHARGALEDPPRSGRSWLTPRPSEGALLLTEPRPRAAGLLETVRSRRSRRNFIPSALDEAAVSLLLKAALPGVGPCQASLILGPGGDLEEGAYVYMPGLHLLIPHRVPSDPRQALARACLDQMWLARAAMILVFWADLERLEEIGGPRTYRHAMLAAGRAGQRLYLAAAALGLGCCGVGAFYDEEAAQILHLPGEALPLYLVACGPVKGGLRPGQP